MYQYCWAARVFQFNVTLSLLLELVDLTLMR